MKPKPEVRVLAKQLFGARAKAIKKKYPTWAAEYLDDLEPDIREVWDAVAREAIKRLKGGEK